MKNFVFISPNFPENYWKFCAELKNNGLRVLGISCLTNKNLPDCMRPAPLEEVIAVAGRAGKDLGRLVEAVVTKL